MHLQLTQLQFVTVQKSHKKKVSSQLSHHTSFPLSFRKESHFPSTLFRRGCQRRGGGGEKLEEHTCTWNSCRDAHRRFRTSSDYVRHLRMSKERHAWSSSSSSSTNPRDHSPFVGANMAAPWHGHEVPRFRDKNAWKRDTVPIVVSVPTLPRCAGILRLRDSLASPSAWASQVVVCPFLLASWRPRRSW